MNAAKRLLRWVGHYPSRLIEMVMWTPLTMTAATLHVALESPSPNPPYATWATAATNLQQAVDAARAGDIVWVTNGVYRLGARTVGASGRSRLALTNEVLVRSVNGPEVTVLEGDGEETRCAYVGSGSVLSGFTLTKGRAPAWPGGGGVYCELFGVVTNCVITGNSDRAAYHGTYYRCDLIDNEGGGVEGATLYDCIIKGNRAESGGGAWAGTLHRCLLENNSARNGGGGAYFATLYDCVLEGNSAGEGGGALGGVLHRCVLRGNSGSGATRSQLVDCTLTGNWSISGGGAHGGTLLRCVLEGNSASEQGGGAREASLSSCVLKDNSAPLGGGAWGGTLNHCTVIGNSAEQAGGVSRARLYNSIVYGNRAPVGANYLWEEGVSPLEQIIEYSCVSPLPPGPGNLDLDPRLASPRHLSVDSPCRAAGSPAYAVGTDFDGEAWANPPSMGCDELVPGQVTGPLVVEIAASFTRALVGEPLQFTARIEGRATRSLWDFGDGVLVTNQPSVVRSWTSPGDYPITLRADNESHPEGVTTTVTVQVFDAAVYFVDAASRNPVPPYRTWATAATTIQDAVDAVTVAGATVWVTNGVYATGGRPVGPNRLPNRVLVNKPMVLRSVHGPGVTVIAGAPSAELSPGGGNRVRCVYLADGATLDGFTLTRGAAGNRWSEESMSQDDDDFRGGAVWAPSTRATVTHCVLTDNTATVGGAAYGATFRACTFSNNAAVGYAGGAAYRCVLEDCTLTANRAMTMEARGGAASECTLRRCLLSDNRAHWFGGGVHASQLDRCTLIGNQAPYGGGASGSTLRACRLTGNQAFQRGGGAENCSLYQCTVTANSAREGGGLAAGRAYNSIVYFNRAESGEPDYSPRSFFGGELTFEYCCTRPLPPGPGNIDRDPGLITATHLAADSPCVGVGLPAYADGVDIDGDPWATPPAMGADQPGPGSTPSPLTVWIEAPFRRALPGHPLSLIAHNTGRIGSTVWDFGDGTTLTNQGFVTRAWAKPGLYPLTLTGYGEALPNGVTTYLWVAVTDAPSYVNPNNPHPAFPYTSWETAATNLQDAIASAASVGTRIWVTNGVYRTGVTRVTHYEYSPIDLLSRVALSNAVVLQSVNGPEVTVIEGGPDGVRCAYVGDGSVLSGFTLTQGTTPEGLQAWYINAADGGGAWCPSTNALLTNCVLIGNSATGNGGGAAGGRLTHCRLIGNRAEEDGGGAFFCDLFHCLVTRNSAGGNGGGVSSATLHDCTLTDNSAEMQGGGVNQGTLFNCRLTGNSAHLGGGTYDAALYDCRLIANTAVSGGAAEKGTLHQCVLTENTAELQGGGVSHGTLVNCLVTANASAMGGGVFDCTLHNSIVRFNRTGSTDAIPFSLPKGDWHACSFSYSCSVPRPPGPGNLDSDPRFVNADTGDFRLRPDSPCIDAGTNRTDLASTDLQGASRLLDGNGDGLARVDMGPYEFDPAIPFITRAEITPTGLRLEWLPAAQDARLQRTIRLAPPDWIEVPGTETMTGITLPANDATGFYRLVRP